MSELAELLALSVPARALTPPGADPAVYEAGQRRWLCSPAGAVQSAMDLRAPERLLLPNHRAMMLATLLSGEPGSVLDLGTGCGGFVRHLAGRSPPPLLTAVESSVRMLELAREFFCFPYRQEVQLTGAREFIEGDGGRYDLVLCDVFAGRRGLPELADKGFYGRLAALLTERGALAINTLPESAGELLSVLEAAHSVFAGLGVLQFESMGNVVLIMQRDPLPPGNTLRERLAVSHYCGDELLAELLGSMQRVEAPGPAVGKPAPAGRGALPGA